MSENTVVYRTNPYTGKSTWTYGKWGGGGWSNGQFTPPGESPFFDGVGEELTELDQVFKSHDQNYQNAQDDYVKSGHTDADKAAYWDAIIQADQKMLESINDLRVRGELGTPPGNAPASPDYIAAAQATSAFWFVLRERQKSRDLLADPRRQYEDGEWRAPDSQSLFEIEYGIDPAASTSFTSARAWVQRSDPLTLDLDGDGLETVGIDTANPILFDHDGDGVKNATGWIKPDDGFLVLDRNGDGVINDGTELFGDSTPVFDADGNVVRKAVDGFDALAQEDTNGDGLVNNQDANWASLRIWQDDNSDGISQASELKSLQELGIAALRVAKTENNTVLSNGNVIADLGSYIYADGHEASLGNVSGAMADIDLADNPFYREFTDQLDTSAVADLPDMQGSGAVRDLREASTLSPELASVLQSYASATTKAEQTALLGEVLNQWGTTGNFNTSVERSVAQVCRFLNKRAINDECMRLEA